MSTVSYTIKDFYEYYLSYVNKSDIYQIDYKLYHSILIDYFKFIQDEIVEQGREFKMPCRLGSLFIMKRKPLKWDSGSLRIDYKTSKDLGKVVYHLNEHSDGYKYRFCWSKVKSMVPYKIKYQLIVTRHNKRRLAHIIKNKERDYVII